MEQIKDEKLEAEDNLILALIDKARLDKKIVLTVRWDCISLAIFNMDTNLLGASCIKNIRWFADTDSAENDRRLKELQEIANG